jgi:protein TonB
MGTGASLEAFSTGVDLASGLSRHAEWVDSGLSTHDYPEAAKRAGLQGVVDLRFTVLTDGRVKECEVERSSGIADLDRSACKMVAHRFLYKLALDASGKPVEELASRRLRFTMTAH